MAATSRFLLDPIGSGAMALRPPSYFAQENPSIKDPTEEREVLAELTALREENVKLKSVQTENTLTSCSDVSAHLFVGKNCVWIARRKRKVLHRTLFRLLNLCE